MSALIVIALVGAVVAIALAGIGLGVVLYRTASPALPKHRHTWTRWEIKEYRGKHVGPLFNSDVTVMIREQERTCTECGFTQVQELP